MCSTPARYAVIFRATVRQLDEEYFATAAALRERAMSEFGCSGFESVAQEGEEISISWWPSLEHIRRWKADPEHLAAQREGGERWYRRYSVQVVEVLREYGRP